MGAKHLSDAWTVDWLGQCVREAGRPGTTEALLKRALKIKEVGGPTMYWLPPRCTSCQYVCGRRGRLGESEEVLERALGIREAKLGADNRNVAYTLDEMGRCAREAGRWEEAEALLKRALEIKEAKLGGDQVHFAVSLGAMGELMQKATGGGGSIV